MANYYFDPVNGDDSNDGLGPYKAAFTSGGTTPIAVGDTVTGGTSGKTAKVVHIPTLTSGSWAGGDAAGNIYVGTPSGAFTAGEALLVSSVDLATLTADFAVSSKKTWTTGASAALLAAGDEIRFRKNEDAQSLGVNMSVNNGSGTVTLSAAVTAVIDDCESAWTQSADVTQSNSTTRIMGSYSQKFAIAAGFTTGKIAYRDFGEGNEKDLSSYTAITLGIYVSAAKAGSMFRIDLCSDASGDTPVDQFTITYGISRGWGSGWNGYLLKKGSALGSSIRSISIHALSDPGTMDLYIDNILATNYLGIGSSLIGLNDGLWYLVNNINGTTITIPNYYYGDNISAQPAYAIHDFMPCDTYASAYNTQINIVNDSGTSGNPIKYRGGWDFSTDSQSTGRTNYNLWTSDGGYNPYCNGKDYLRFEQFRFVNGNRVFMFGGQCEGIEFDDVEFHSNNVHGPYFDDGYASWIKAIEGTCIFNTNQTAYLPCNSQSRLTGTIISLQGTNLLFGRNGASSYLPAVVIEGTIHGRGASSGPTVSLNCHAWARKIILYGGNMLRCGSPCNVRVETLEQKSASSSQIGYPYVDEQLGCGNVTIDNYKYSGTLTVALWYQGYMGHFNEWNCLHLNGAGDAYCGCAKYANWGDHVSMGQAAGWAYGGTGKSLVVSPTDTTFPYFKHLYAPVVSGETYKLTMQVKKTSSGATCTLKAHVSGAGIAAIRAESVTLTDSWALYESTSFTPSTSGLVHIVLEFLDGGTSGDIGIDEIKVAKQ